MLLLMVLLLVLAFLIFIQLTIIHWTWILSSNLFMGRNIIYWKNAYITQRSTINSLPLEVRIMYANDFFYYFFLLLLSLFLWSQYLWTKIMLTNNFYFHSWNTHSFSFCKKNSLLLPFFVLQVMYIYRVVPNFKD